MKEQVAAAPLGILPPPPYRLVPEYLRRCRRTGVLALLGALAAFALYGLLLAEGEPGTFGQVVLAFGGSLAVLGWRSLRQHRLGSAVAQTGMDVLCKVVGFTEQRSRLDIIALVYTILVPPLFSRPERQVKVSFPYQQGKPLFLPGEHVLALVVEAQPKMALVLRQDLWPLDFAAEQRRLIGARLAKVDPQTGWRIVETSKGPRLMCDRDVEARARAGAARRRAESGRAG
ncbi:MAG TPA: hypothetical protein VK348_08535 [Planctomycetota bacterium]|nr:hypothetical protein [Planctomycetota bacterium]